MRVNKGKKMLNRKLFSFLFILLCFCVAGVNQHVKAISLMEQKLNLEKSIQERTERLVEKIIGSKEMVVLVNVTLGSESTRTAEGKTPSYRGEDLTQEEYLPGITYSYLPGSTGAESPGAKTIIRQIVVSITVDKSVSRMLATRIKKEVNELLGLDPIRGDKVDVNKIAFAVRKLTWQDYYEDWSTLFYWLATLLFVLFIIIGPLRYLFRTVVRAMEMRVEADTRIRSTEHAGSSTPGATAANPLVPTGPLDITLSRERRGQSSQKSDLQDRRKRFGFVVEDNIKNLMYLLKDETPKRIAVVVNFMSPELSSQVLNSLSGDIQSQVVTNLADVKLLTQEEVHEIEQDIKSKIDFLSGGEDYFVNILDHVDRGSQENILSTLEKENPVLANKLRNSLFFFEDIVILDKATLQRIIRESQGRGISLALTLKDVDEKIKSKVMESLTEGARAMLTEQIDLLGEVTAKRITEEQQLFANIVRELEKAGEIVVDREKKKEGWHPTNKED